MAIREHPAKGAILQCNFEQGFREPEMVKQRPVIVLSPKIHARPFLCTIVALSTSAPNPSMPYHTQIEMYPALPYPFESKMWVKGDMLYSVGFHRLDFIRAGKDKSGKRKYYDHTLSNDQLKVVQRCVLHGIGLSVLTKHL